MDNFITKTLNNLTNTVLNLIVIAISSLAILGLALFPTFKISAKATFTKELASIVAPAKDNPTEEDEIVQLVISELVKENVSLKFELKFTLFDAFACALDGTAEKTKEKLFLYSDTIAESVDDKVIEKVEKAVTKAGVSTIIKKQINSLSNTLGNKSDEVMQNIGVDEDYISAKTQDILNSIKSDGANVDSVTDTIMTIVDDVDVKLQNSQYKNEVDSLTEENREEIRQAVEDLVNSIADENGNFDGNSLIAVLLSGLALENSNQASASPNHTSFAPNKVLYEQEHQTQTKSVDQVLKEKLRSLISDEIVQSVKTAFLAIFLMLVISVVLWAYLILKILFRLNAKNPLIKLKAPIAFSWFPFAILYALPKVISLIFKNPPQIITSVLLENGFAILSKIGSAIKLSYFSSTLIPFVLSIVLLIFSVFYSAKRKQIDKDMKSPKNQPID